MNIRKIRKIVKAEEGWKSYGYKYSYNPTGAITEYERSLENYYNNSKLFNNTENTPKNTSGNSVDTAKLLEYTLNILGNYSNISNNSTTNAINLGIDIGASMLQKIPGVGTTIGSVLKIGNSVGGLLKDTGLVKNTDGMTTIDSILDSNIMAFSPISWANTAFGKKSITVHKDTALQSKQGNEYTGTFLYINNTIDKYGNKSYGAFSSGSRRNANKKLRKAKDYLDIIGNINSNSENDNLIAASMSQLRNDSYNSKLLGGVNYSKKGGTLDSKIKRVKKRKTKPIWKSELILSWEPIETSFESWFNSIPEKYRGSNYDYKKAYEVLDLEELQRYVQDPYNNHLRSVSPIADENGNIPFLKLGTLTDNPELLGEFDFYNNNDSWKEKYDILYIGDRYYYVPKKFKDGGKLNIDTEKEQQKNVIPEGALHKNKHNMEDAEGLTKKGIPVVDNEGELQAEIERNELIFTLEVTKLLEESLEKYNSEESLTKKDEIAIEVGKLLVEQILYNTDDKTGLIDETA